jgi:superfamily II DNA/RNA helicase
MNQAFSDFPLPDELLRALARQGFERPTPVQREVIPAAIAGKDLMVSAATGSGKTAAFLLPMLQRFVDNPEPRTGTRALILVPTRELARQVYDHFIRLAGYTRLTAGVITGGAPLGHQVAALRRNPEILIATPGRLLEHLEKGNADLDDLEMLILDEADRMLDMGFSSDVLEIIGRSNPDRQSLLFSATLDRRGLEPIEHRLLREAQIVMTDPIRERHPHIRHQILLADDPAHKQRLLLRLLTDESFDRALVFANTREGASVLGGYLVQEGVRAAALHGELDQRERNRVLGLLRQGQIRALVATDLAARGLDVPGMGLVINFEVARSGSDYLHRTGRTGRAGEEGLAISLIGPGEWNRMEGIVRYLGLEIETRTLEGLKARFQGRRRSKVKKRPGPEKKPKAGEAAPKAKDRHRDRKNKGKRRKPSRAPGVEAGHGPLRRRD